MPWMLPGSAIATRSRSPWRATGIAMTRWRVSRRHELARVGRDPLLLEIDERQVVAPRERSCDAFGFGAALVP